MKLTVVQHETGTKFVRRYCLRCHLVTEGSWSIDGLQALVDQHKPQPEEENREYRKVLITAFEQGERERPSISNATNAYAFRN